jgi:glyoxylase-like metal-dependent hydrolase (beta-lactamase superfamily II)
MPNKIFSQLMTSCLAMVFICASVSAQEANRSITRIKGDLYRFQNNFHYSVFLVTPDGIIATDPINADAAKWLKEELDKRFDKPVKYLIYSHDHVDHIAGGEVFADSAVVVAHDTARADIIGENRPTAVPDITFSDRLGIELGGKKVELTFVGKSHSDNMIVMYFPDANTLFAVDFIPVKSVPWKTLTDAFIPEWIDAVKKVEAMEFEILVPGHGALGSSADVTAFREYMEQLYAAVLQAARDGKSLEEMQQSIRLDQYAGWQGYEDQLPLNIEGMYNQIRLHRRGN